MPGGGVRAWVQEYEWYTAKVGDCAAQSAVVWVKGEWVKGRALQCMR